MRYKVSELAPQQFAPAGLIDCRRCPRLVAYREKIAKEKRRAYLQEQYWGKPVPGFGDLNAKIMLLGLAPGAHGSNRTGRMFTGDGSGDFLFPALWRTGFASQPQSTKADDGMRLTGIYITAPARCAPPGNKPTRQEFENCSGWLLQDFAAMPNLQLVIALGRLAHEAYLKYLQHLGHEVIKARVPFAHGNRYRFDHAPILQDSYHVSLQNTQTGRLTPAMFDEILHTAAQLTQ